jgi:hypothetical protein
VRLIAIAALLVTTCMVACTAEELRFEGPTPAATAHADGAPLCDACDEPDAPAPFDAGEFDAFFDDGPLPFDAGPFFDVLDVSQPVDAFDAPFVDDGSFDGSFD